MTQYCQYLFTSFPVSSTRCNAAMTCSLLLVLKFCWNGPTGCRPLLGTCEGKWSHIFSGEILIWVIIDLQFYWVVFNSIILLQPLLKSQFLIKTKKVKRNALQTWLYLYSNSTGERKWIKVHKCYYTIDTKIVCLAFVRLYHFPCSITCLVCTDAIVVLHIGQQSASWQIIRGKHQHCLAKFH